MIYGVMVRKQTEQHIIVDAESKAQAIEIAKKAVECGKLKLENNELVLGTVTETYTGPLEEQGVVAKDLAAWHGVFFDKEILNEKSV